ncbi:MAG: hypothetical protein OHK93_005525 [Ramalina farinacea]|uniref:Flavin-containing monooxygenase n=1 Tax=Ramalina farinacea TaxID=258253 RepID=A0AA43QGV4_9LECA|nr:hypothetical protein [Ramalina farinacea]
MLEIPASNGCVPGSGVMKHPAYPKASSIASTSPPDPERVISEWLSSFNAVAGANDASQLSSLFLEESYWRDLLCLTWDFHTMQGPEKICVQAFVHVETDVGSGRGMIKLLPDDNGWKAYTLFTVLQELKGHEETVGEKRTSGSDPSGHSKKNWQEKRIAEENLEDGFDPAVLIVGSGQGGLTVGARLKQLGVDAVIIDRNPRIGDNWRNRYHQLVLHDSVWYDHMPYLNFPPNWPVFTPKDKLAEWFELYAKALELNVWTGTNLLASEWDGKERRWTVTIERERDGKKETRASPIVPGKIHPRHVIQATGHSGEPYIPTEIKGLDDFKGDRLVHSSQFDGPQKNAKGKKAVIVGCCNSGHDIAHDFFEHGYDVTMIQRSSTLVVNGQTLIDVDMKGVYSEDGPPVEDADLLTMAVPNPVSKRMKIDSTAEINRRDASLLNGLQAAGFALDNGPDCAGLYMKYIHRGGGYYIDVGTSQLIANGKIKIKQGQEIERINAHSLTFKDGSELEADEIVLATGYQNMRETARKIFGDQLADGVKVRVAYQRVNVR